MPLRKRSKEEAGALLSAFIAPALETSDEILSTPAATANSVKEDGVYVFKIPDVGASDGVDQRRVDLSVVVENAAPDAQRETVE
ncbi:hypothetical protein FN846DRAFT_913594 [Sphaerosporella brunnea]|uniref:Uncharacterized protein n=1 Tax=Sphaerosporella brunnea TaxID=1250544 RepID=A0A5J5EGD3_9PEZI|nr:hypothetical protein FN846DRAFT_913594 [Sphaerosporella brunnea]